MQEKNKHRLLTNSAVLQNRLWVESIITNPPMPFGSLSKAKYLLFKNGKGHDPIYFFTTTCRNTEDCINILSEKYEAELKEVRYFKIFKVQNGKSEFIYTNKPIDKP